MSYSFLTRKTKSFITLVAKNLEDSFSKEKDYIEMIGPIGGKLYFSQSTDNVKLTISKEELESKVTKETFDSLPEVIFFV